MRASIMVLACLAASSRLIAQESPAQRADTLPPAGVDESDFSFANGRVTLAGTLTVPRGPTGPMPVAVLIAGSGPTDRNGNSHLGPGMVYRNNSLSQLAWRLAEQGIATLRYDKRVLPASMVPIDTTRENALAEYQKYIEFDNFAEDAAAAARSLERDRRFSMVVLVGHSEGAGLAIQAANGGAPADGVVLLAGLGRPFLTVLRSQLAVQFDSSAMLVYDSAMARYLRGDSTGPVPPGLAPLFAPAHRSYMRTSSKYDPQAEIVRLKVPVLIVQGTTDIQVSVEDARLMQRARPEATLVVIEGANHVFKMVEGTSQAAQLPSYTDPTMAIVPELPAAITRWIDQLRGR
jgi:pimeloyl-ACP methyl ester carboxylesterase